MRNIQSLHWMLCLRNNETEQIYKTAIRAERDLETAVKLIEQGKMTEEEVAEFYHFTKAQMKLVKEKVAVLA